MVLRRSQAGRGGKGLTQSCDTQQNVVGALEGTKCVDALERQTRLPAQLVKEGL